MDIWTNGSLAVALDKHGLSVHEDGEARVLLGPDEVEPEGVVKWRDVLAVDPERGVAWLVDGSGRGRAVELDTGAVIEFDEPLLDLVVLPDGGLVGALADGDRAQIVPGFWKDDAFVWGEPFDEVESVSRVNRRDLIWTPGVEPWSRKRLWSPRPADVRLNLSPFGLAVADGESGVVAVKRDPSEPGGFDFACRLPAQAESEMHASASPRGVVAMLVVEGREAAVVNITEEGQLFTGVDQRDHDDLWYGGPVQVFREDAAAYFGHEADLELALPGLTLEKSTRSRLGSAERLVVASEGDALEDLTLPELYESITSCIESYKRGERSGGAEELPDAVEGEPELTLVCLEPETLSVAAGEAFEATFKVTNLGGVCDGLEFGFEGGAAAKRLLGFEELSVDTASAEPTRRGARIEEARVDAARPFVDEQDKLSYTPGEARVVLRGEAARAGSGMLMVRVCPTGDITTEAAAGRCVIPVEVR